MNWKKLNSIDELPRDRTFLLWDSKCESGISIYEAMIFDDGTIGDPAVFEKFEVKDFSHWCEIVGPDEKQGIEQEFVNALDGVDYSKYLKEIVTVRFK